MLFAARFVRFFAAVAGEGFGRWVNEILAIVGCGGGFAETCGDEIEFAFKTGHIAGGENAGNRSCHRAGMHHHAAAFNIQAPFFNRADIRYKTKIQNQSIRM